MYFKYDTKYGCHENIKIFNRWNAVLFLRITLANLGKLANLKFIALALLNLQALISKLEIAY